MLLSSDSFLDMCRETGVGVSAVAYPPPLLHEASHWCRLVYDGRYLVVGFLFTFGCLVTYVSIFDLFPFFYTIITYLVT